MTIDTATTDSFQKSLAIIVPAFNEEGSIGGVLVELNGISQVLSKQGWQVEIVVVDDGSCDRTAEETRQHERVTLLKHRENRGYGAALKTGIRHVDARWVCITDADGTYPNVRVPDMADQVLCVGCDMIVGARIGDDVAIPLFRRPAKWIIRRLASYVANVHIPDLNSGLRIFDRQAALRLFGILPDGFSFTTTITLGMVINGYLVEYFPIDYYARVGKSKIRPIPDTLNFFQLVLRIALYFAPLKIFVPLSGFIMLLALLWALLSRVLLGQIADITTLVISMSALQILVLGMLAELINHRLPNSYKD